MCARLIDSDDGSVGLVLLELGEHPAGEVVFEVGFEGCGAGRVSAT